MASVRMSPLAEASAPTRSVNSLEYAAAPVGIDGTIESESQPSLIEAGYWPGQPIALEKVNLLILRLNVWTSQCPK